MVFYLSEGVDEQHTKPVIDEGTKKGYKKGYISQVPL